MNRLLLFNCSNDLALAAGTKEYIAPKSIKAMEETLSALPAWWAEEGDAVLLANETQRTEAEEFFKQKKFNIIFTSPEEGYEALRNRTRQDFTPNPWGWSKAAARQFSEFGVPSEQLPSDKELNETRTLSSREFAACYITELLADATKTEIFSQQLLGNEMRFIRSVEEFSIHHRTIFKSPWSSSGRGIFSADSIDAPSIKDKLTGFIKRQGGFIADKFYEKKSDFALEFYINDNGSIDFLGYSVFIAGTNGYYGHNIIDSQPKLRNIILENGCNEALLDWLIAYHSKKLSEKLAGKYKGVVGIDMLTATENDFTKVHPCVEINLRMNMGVLAMNIYDRIGKGCYPLTPNDKNCKYTATVEHDKLIIGVV